MGQPGGESANVADLKRQLAAERDHGQRLQMQLDAILRTDSTQLSGKSAQAASAPLTRERFDAAFLVACSKQDSVAAHTPTWRPLIDLVWDELHAAHLESAAQGARVPEVTDAWAERFCDAVNWHPDGTENKVIEGEWHSVTFRELAKGYIRAMLVAGPTAMEHGNEAPTVAVDISDTDPNWKDPEPLV